MSRTIDGQFSVSQIPNVQQLSTAAAREAELAEQRQRIAARRAQEAEQARVEKEQAVEGKTIRDEDPREDRKQRSSQQADKKKDEAASPESIDITL